MMDGEQFIQSPIKYFEYFLIYFKPLHWFMSKFLGIILYIFILLYFSPSNFILPSDSSAFPLRYLLP